MADRDRIAMFIYPNGGLIATRDKLTVVRGRTGLEIMKNMYQAAPDVKVVYFFTMASDSAHYKPTMEELKKVGYDNIKMVNAASWMSTEYFSRSSIEVSIGESFAYVPICAGEYKPSDFQIYEKTSEGYIRVGDEKVCEIGQFQKCPKLKNVCIPMTDGDFSESEKTRMKNMFPSQTVHFVRSKGRNWLKCIWDEYDGKVENFLPARFTLNVYFKYGNAVHLEKVEYNDQMSVNIFNLDIDDARKLDVDVKYDRLEIEHLKSYKFRVGKSRVLKITLKVGLDFIPEVAVAIDSEYDTVQGVVYSVDFNHATNRFTGRLITGKDTTNVIISNSDDIYEVFKQLDMKKGSAKLRGVLLDYPGHGEFPLDVHRNIIDALPFRKTPICIAQIHSYWAIHLRNSGVQLEVGEFGIMFRCTSWENEDMDYYRFEKTRKGFRIISRHDDIPYHLPISAFVIITYEKQNTMDWMMMKSIFPTAKIAISESSKLLNDVGYEFAWHYFTGSNFDGYMTEPSRGVTFAVQHDGCNECIELCCDPNYGTLRCDMACTLDKSKSSNFSVSMYCIGFEKKYTVIEVPKPNADFGFLYLSVDEMLNPIVTVTESATPLLSGKWAAHDKRYAEKLKIITVEHAPNSNPASVKSIDTVEKHNSLETDAETDIKPDDNTVWLQQSDRKSTTSEVLPTPSVILTFTSCNRVLIVAGPNYTGDNQFPAYLRLTHKN